MSADVKDSNSKEVKDGKDASNASSQGAEPALLLIRNLAKASKAKGETAINERVAAKWVGKRTKSLGAPFAELTKALVDSPTILLDAERVAHYRPLLRKYLRLDEESAVLQG